MGILLKLRAAVTSTMVLSLRLATPSSADLAGDPGGSPTFSRGMVTEENRAHVTSAVAMNNDFFCKWS